MKILNTIAERARQEDPQEYADRISHQCHGCHWGTWVGTGYFCLFPRCMRNDPFYVRMKERDRVRSVMKNEEANGD